MSSSSASAYFTSLDDEQLPEEPTSIAGQINPDDEAVDVLAGRRAVLYLRVSSVGQVNTDYDPEGISIPAQRSSCERKAEQMGYVITGEYVEPGKSATEMTKRVAFQEMLRRIKTQKDVDHVIVYKLSRLNRNRLDDAIVMADLRERGVTLVSATESIDDTPVGQLMHGILAAFNEYRSREDGADIAYKMGEKAKKGGTLGIAPLGYINSIDRIEGREIRSVAIDPIRAPFVKLAFELFATGEYTLMGLSDELTRRGLLTRPTARRPAQPVSKTKLSQMLRDRYYLGIVTYKGAEYDGRHEQLIDDALFDRVQEVIEGRSTAKERRRVHHHYLKGSLYCGRCRHDGPERRMVVQRTVNPRGTEYFYFFCRGIQEHTCQMPFVPIPVVEDAVLAHYATIAFTPAFIAAIREQMDQTLNDTIGAAQLQKRQLTNQLTALDTKEENLIDLAADGTLAHSKIRTRLHEIERQRETLKRALAEVSDDLSAGARLIEVCLRLLQNPQELYRRCDDTQRRQLNQAIFVKLYVEEDHVTKHVLREPFAELHVAQHSQQLAALATSEGDGGRKSAVTDLRQHPTERIKATQEMGGLDVVMTSEGLLKGMDLVHCLSKPSMVELRGIEPRTSSMRTKRATNCATAPWPADPAASRQQG